MGAQLARAIRSLVEQQLIGAAVALDVWAVGIEVQVCDVAVVALTLHPEVVASVWTSCR